MGYRPQKKAVKKINSKTILPLYNTYFEKGIWSLLPTIWVMAEKKTKATIHLVFFLKVRKKTIPKIAGATGLKMDMFSVNVFIVLVF